MCVVTYRKRMQIFNNELKPCDSTTVIRNKINVKKKCAFIT